MASTVSYYYVRTAPRAAPAVVTTPVIQIYVVPRAVVAATPPAGHQSFWPNFPVKAANVPLTRPVAAATRSLAPGPAKMEHMQVRVVQTTANTVVSAPRRFVPGPPTKESLQGSLVQTATKTVVSAPRPATGAGLVGPNLEVPLSQGVEKLAPLEVDELLRAGQCLVVDVRAADRASGHIKGSVHEPTSFQAPLLNRVPELVAKFSKEKLVIFHCQYSMHRGPQCANWYRQQAPTSQRVAVMEGGFRGWERQRLPVVHEQPMDAQVQAKADVYALSMGRRVAGAGA
ncbi:ACR2.2 [Symbiodinium sp. CCMP2592]|nr:ACR2.2 [Symbiodinium sp. CCMP2592]